MPKWIINAALELSLCISIATKNNSRSHNLPTEDFRWVFLFVLQAAKHNIHNNLAPLKALNNVIAISIGLILHASLIMISHVDIAKIECYLQYHTETVYLVMRIIYIYILYNLYHWKNLKTIKIYLKAFGYCINLKWRPVILKHLGEM